VPSELNILVRPSIQPYLISWLRYNPAKEIGELRIPVLIVHGTTDIQVPLADAKGLVEGNPRATLLSIDGMNHVLKTVANEKEKQVASYSDPALPVAPELVSAISKFVNRVRDGD
jgi:fermentation-respiration switch protein FrsA (DUF1100 family)